MTTFEIVNNPYFGSTLTSSSGSYIDGGVYQVPNSYYSAESPYWTDSPLYRIEPVLVTVGNPQAHEHVLVPLNSVIVGNSFVTYPAEWQTQLTADYSELGQTLAELKDPSADEWQIDEPVYEVARQVASALMAQSYPAPKLLTHGRKSVVFNWEAADNRSLYLTISKDYVSALVSSPAKIERRVEVPVAVLIETSLLVSPFVEWTEKGRPVISSGHSLELATL